MRDVRGHVRHAIEIPIESFGFAQCARAGPRARASSVHPNPWPAFLRLIPLRRPPNVTLKLSKDLLIVCGYAANFYLIPLQLSSSVR